MCTVIQWTDNGHPGESMARAQCPALVGDSPETGLVNTLPVPLLDKIVPATAPVKGTVILTHAQVGSVYTCTNTFIHV